MPCKQITPSRLVHGAGLTVHGSGEAPRGRPAAPGSQQKFKGTKRSLFMNWEDSQNDQYVKTKKDAPEMQVASSSGSRNRLSRDGGT